MDAGAWAVERSTESPDYLQLTLTHITPEGVEGMEPVFFLPDDADALADALLEVAQDIREGRWS